MAEGAIEVHIMAPRQPKRVEAFDDTMVWHWLGWHCMDGMIGGTKHVPDCTLAYGFTGRLAGILQRWMQWSGDESKSVERELSILVQNKNNE